MRDNYGDKLDVLTEDGDVVLVSEYSGELMVPGDQVQTPLSAAKARKLAKKLQAAASEIERADEDFVTNVSRDDSPVPLTLSREQAETLAVILCKIGGTTGHYDTPFTPRQFANEIQAKLQASGVHWLALNDLPEFAVHPEANSIYFTGFAE